MFAMRDGSTSTGFAPEQTRLFEYRDSSLQFQLDALSPQIKSALSFPICSAASLKISANSHQTVEEIVDDAVSRCVDITLDDAGYPGSSIVNILNGMSLLANTLHIECSRYFGDSN